MTDEVLPLAIDGVLFILNEEEVTTLRKAHAIGRASYDGDSWFAKDAGYGYDDAEATMRAAELIFARLTGHQ